MKTSISTWLNDLSIPAAHPSLSEITSKDVVIVGGGLAGTLAGYLLSKAGKKTVILEKSDLKASTTAYTTAWLNCVIDTDLHDLIKIHGDEDARKIWQSGMDAIDLIEKIIQEENIDCEFKRVPHYLYVTREKDIKTLQKEEQAAKKIGFETILRDEKHLKFTNSGALKLDSQAKFHPIKFLLGLQQAFVKYGGIIYENTEVEDITGGNPVLVKTKGGSVKAEYVIITTYKPFNKPRELFAHTGMYISYVIEAIIPPGLINEGLYEDGENPYHYFRIDRGAGKEGADRIILGGEDHRKEIPTIEDNSFRALEKYLSELLLDKKYTIVRRWTGPILESIDGLPFIGPYGYRNRLVATGFSGNGMTYSAISAQILSDIVLNQKNEYENLYRADRKIKLYSLLIKGIDFAGEFFGGAMKNFFK